MYNSKSFILYFFLLQLLLGIKDVDDNLVASTLICLSELVPILGADTVIGGTRSKLFTDGRPNSKTSLSTGRSQEDLIFLSKKKLRDFHCSEDVYENSSRNNSEYEKAIVLNERPSPVGGESVDEEVVLTKCIKNNLEDSEDDWSDWDNTNRQLTIASDTAETHNEEDKYLESENSKESSISTTTYIVDTAKPGSRTLILQKAALEAKKNIVDISELDIKNQKPESKSRTGEEIDFFADMMPVIEKPTVVNVAQKNISQNFSKLNFVPDQELDESEGWGENWNE